MFVRRDEVEVMELVGATDWYIRWPCIVEGLFYGVIATALSIIILLIGYFALIRPMVESYVVSTSGNPVFTVGFLVFLGVTQLVVALGVGGFSSYLATKKHLNV